MQSATFKVPDITCDGCIGSMQFALRRKPGVVKLEGDARRKTVTIQYDETKTDPGRIKEALEEIGFPATG
ncbi:MAG: heavy-metal-associated domain-containing protein [Chloroflexi bacterium]|nr:heavy-metal-associated domain-containing protein [Chloroflexota bacterium]